MCKEDGENPLHALPEFVQRFPRDRSKTTQYHPVLVKKKTNQKPERVAIPRASKKRKCYGQTTLNKTSDVSFPSCQAGLVISSGGRFFLLLVLTFLFDTRRETLFVAAENLSVLDTKTDKNMAACAN